MVPVGDMRQHMAGDEWSTCAARRDGHLTIWIGYKYKSGPTTKRTREAASHRAPPSCHVSVLTRDH